MELQDQQQEGIHFVIVGHRAIDHAGDEPPKEMSIYCTAYNWGIEFNFIKSAKNWNKLAWSDLLLADFLLKLNEHHQWRSVIASGRYPTCGIGYNENVQSLVFRVYGTFLLPDEVAQLIPYARTRFTGVSNGTAIRSA